MSHISHFLSACDRGQRDCCCRSGWPGARTLPSSPTSNPLERGENTNPGASQLVPVLSTQHPVPAILSSLPRFDPSQLPYFKYRQAMAQLAANSTQVSQVNISYLLFMVYGDFK